MDAFPIQIPVQNWRFPRLFPGFVCGDPHGARPRAKGAELQKVLDELSALNEKLASLRSVFFGLLLDFSEGVFFGKKHVIRTRHDQQDYSDCRKYGCV